MAAVPISGGRLSLGLAPLSNCRHLLKRSCQRLSHRLVSTLLAGALPLQVAAEPRPTPHANGPSAPSPLSATGLPDNTAGQRLRPLSLQEAQQLARVNHPALQAAALAVESRQAQLKASLAAWKPQVTLQSSAGLPALALEYQYTPDTSYPRGELETNLKVEAAWLWRDPQREARVAAERHELEQVRMQHQLLQRDVKLQVAESYYELQRTDAEVDLRLASVQAAQATLKISRARHEAGVAARLDVLQGQAQLTDVEALLTDAPRPAKPSPAATWPEP